MAEVPEDEQARAKKSRLAVHCSDEELAAIEQAAMQRRFIPPPT